MEKKFLSLLWIVIAAQLLLAAAWILIDRTPPYWDEAWYLYQGAQQYLALQQGIPEWYAAWTQLDPQRPSFVPMLTIPFYALLGLHADAGLAANLAGLLLLLVATFALGRAIAGAHVGLLAVLLVGGYPMTLGLTHILMVELVMVALVAFTLLGLWKSNRFTQLHWSVLAGVGMGLGVLTKVFYPMFIIGPLLVTVLAAFGRPDQRRLLGWQRFRNMLACAATALAIALWWYIPNLQSVINRSVDAAVGTEGSPYGPASPWAPNNLLAYFLGLVGARISLFGFLLFLIGLGGIVYLLARRRWTRHQPSQAAASVLHPFLFLMSSILLAYLVFTSLNNQSLKHISGIVPAVALITAWGGSLWVRTRWALLVAVLFFVFQGMAGTFPGGRGILPAGFLRSVSVPIGTHRFYLYYPAQPAYIDGDYTRPDDRPWPLREILAYGLMVADLELLPRDQAHVAIVPDSVGVEPYAFLYEALSQNMPVRIQGAHTASLWDQDVLISKTGDLGFVPHLPIANAVLEAVHAPDSEFHLMPRTFALPYGDEAILYARRPSPLLAQPPAPAYPGDAVFADAARFGGADIVAASGEDGERTLTITYYWESLGPTQRPASVFVHLLDPESGAIVVQDDHLLFPKIYPTTMWQPDRWLQETRVIVIPPSFAGPALHMRLGLYDEAGRLPITGPSGQAGSDSFDLGRVPLDAP